MSIRTHEVVTTYHRALELLVWGRFGGNRSQMRLRVPPRGRARRMGEEVETGGPYIEISHYGGHYDVWQSADEYPTTPEVVQELKSRGYIEGVPQWGYTSNRELKASAWGEEVYFRHKEALRLAVIEAVFWWLPEVALPSPEDMEV